MERLVIIWMSHFITASTAIWWMEWVLRTVQINFIQKLTPKLWNQVESTRHTIQLCLVWLVMVWTSSLRISTLQLKWKLEIGCAFQEWEPILMDLRAISTEWRALKKSSDGTPNFMKIQSNNSNLQEFKSSDYYSIFIFCVFFLDWLFFIVDLRLRYKKWVFVGIVSCLFRYVGVFSIDDLNPTFP